MFPPKHFGFIFYGYHGRKDICSPFQIYTFSKSKHKQRMKHFALAGAMLKVMCIFNCI